MQITQLLKKKNKFKSPFNIIIFDKKNAKTNDKKYFYYHLKFLSKENGLFFLLSDEIFCLNNEAIRKGFSLFNQNDYKFKIYHFNTTTQMLKFITYSQSIHNKKSYVKKLSVSDIFKTGVFLHNKWCFSQTPILLKLFLKSYLEEVIKNG